MSKPTKSLKTMCKKLGVRLTIKRGQKRVYKSVAVLKKQCAKKKKAKRKRKVKRRRRFGLYSVQGRRKARDRKNREFREKIQAVKEARPEAQVSAEALNKEINRRKLMKYLKYAGLGAAGLGTAGLGGYAGYRYYKRRRRKTGGKKKKGKRK